MNAVRLKLNQIKGKFEKLDMYYLVRKKRSAENNYIAFRILLASSIIQEIVDLLIDTTVARLDDKEIRDFNPVNTEAGTIETLPVRSVNNLTAITRAISTLVPENQAELDFQSIWGYCIVITYTDEKPLVFYKKYTYPKRLKKSLMLRLTDGIYDKIENNIVTVDSETDAFLLDDKVYILNKSQFEKFFNFSMKYEEIIESSIESLKQLNVIDGFDDFTQQCLSSDTLTRRLVKIIHDARFKTLQRCLNNVPNVIDAYALNVKFVNNKIIYDDESNVSDIITLIRGACVIGALDAQKYLANDTKPIDYAAGK